MKVAFVGLGAMGAPMAARIAGGQGVDLRVFDVRGDALERASFAARALSLRDATSDADVICTMLPADAHVSAVAEELLPTARAGQLFIDFSTVAPWTIDAIATRLGSRGVTTMSASCMKSVAAAKTGELSLFVAGSASALDRVAPLLDRVAASWRVVETLGAAKTLKLVNNAVVAASGFVALDALVVASALGCDCHRAAQALRAAGADSWALRNHVIEYALADRFDPGIFSVSYMSKDLQLAVDLAGRAGAWATFASLVLAGYRGVTAMGHGDSYHPVVVRWLERISSLDPITSRGGVRATSELAALWRGAASVQRLVVDEGLEICAAAGMERAAAAALLQTGSAESDWMATFARAETPRAATSTDDGDPIDAARTLAASVSMPALSLVAARQAQRPARAGVGLPA